MSERLDGVDWLDELDFALKPAGFRFRDFWYRDKKEVSLSGGPF